MSKHESTLSPMRILDSVEIALDRGDLVAAVVAISDLAPALRDETQNDHRSLKGRIDNLIHLARQQRQQTKLELKKISGVNTAATRYQEIASGQ